MLAALAVLSTAASAAIPAPEKLLPDDTLVLLTVPDFARVRALYKASPQSQFWNDPAMKPFKDKFLSKWNEELVKPLERDLNIKLDQFLNLPQGQLTVALTQDGWQGKDDQPGMLLLLDSKDKSSQLKTNLANLRKQWVDAGKAIRTEKIRNVEFSVLKISTNDLPKTLQGFLPKPAEAEEPPAEGEVKKAPAKSDLIIGQADSLLIVGSSLKAVEKVVARLSGGSAPTLGDSGAYAANHQAMFREAPLYGWINVKAFIDILTRKPAAPKPDADEPSPFPGIQPEKIITALGLGGLKTLAFTFQDSAEGWLLQFYLGAPEASRQGLFKILAGEAKESSPPAFVPASAVKFQRWRMDGQKAFATFQKMLGDINPQWLNALNFLLDTADNAAKEKDPAFDIRKNLIGNLGDDIISYEKAARGATGAAPSLILLGSPHPDQLAAALKNLLVIFGQQSSAPTEREFLGRKIFTISLPPLPLPMGGGGPAGGSRTLTYAPGSTYLALSTDPALIEEYLRSSESQAKALRETPGLLEASQRVTGPGTGLFGYENQVETMRVAFESLKREAAAPTNSALSSLAGPLNLPGQKSLREWMDFTLLPAYDKVAKYFYFSVYGGTATADGLTVKVFSPVPPGLKGAAK